MAVTYVLRSAGCSQWRVPTARPLLEFAGWILSSRLAPAVFLMAGSAAEVVAYARLGGDAHFLLLEADEYDSAFLRQALKLVHLPARTAVLTILEYDHADIFPVWRRLNASFHHFWCVACPPAVCIIYPQREEALERVIAMGLLDTLPNHGRRAVAGAVLEADGFRRF